MKFFPRNGKQSLSPLRKKRSWRASSLFLTVATALFFIAFLAGVYLFFPGETLRQRLIQEVSQQADLELQLGSLTLQPLLTLAAGDIRIMSPDIPWPLEIEELEASPNWMSVLTGDPGANIRARLMDGSLSCSLQKSGNLNVRSAGLRFDLPLTNPMALRLTGRVDEVALDTGIRLNTDTQTNLFLKLNETRILELDLSGAGDTSIALDEITLQVEGQGRSMQITALEARGGDLLVTGEGVVIIGRTAETSRLRLTLQMRPAAGLDPAVASLFDLAGKPQPDGSYSLQISGSLAQPLIRPGG
ncbi:MAG TPA: type II secretion system protein GspN [Desulfuromonadales bacterium]|nr:type II secretion system protein GspN [Desulfuromonadales bacterium]